MRRFAYIASTLILGVFLQTALAHYLSLYDVFPQIFLLLTISNGFALGPILGEILGFFWGTMSDATGVRLFGINMFLMTFAGYAAGRLRRRVASERLATQVVIALVATVYYAVAVPNLHRLFDAGGHHFSYARLILQAAYNALFVTLLFYATERWAQLWKLPREHV